MVRRLRSRAPSLLMTGAARVGRSVATLWFSGPLHRLLLGGRHPLKMLGALDLNWPGDDAAVIRGTGLLSGRYTACGRDFNFDADDFGALDGALPKAARPALQNFSWLDDLAALSDDIDGARHFAEQAVRSWITTYPNWLAVAWQPDVVGARLMSWITHAPLVLSSGDMDYRSAVLDSMARQARHLKQAMVITSSGPHHVTAAAGLVAAAILLPGLEGKRKPGLEALRLAVERNVLADGSPPTRNPADTARIIRELITVKACFEAVTLEPPAWLQSALDRALPALLALDHGDHLRAQFNGAYARVGQPDSFLAEAADAHGRAPASLPYGGYERIKRWRTSIIVDAGVPPSGDLSATHHAAPLAMEFCDGKDRIIVNMGGSGSALVPIDSLAALSRTTAAHSTLIIGDTNAAEIRLNGQIGYGPTVVEVEREENEDGVWLTAEHDGYVRKWNAVHKRALYLNAAGTDFRGEDIVAAVSSGGTARRARRKAETDIQVRFHLHPMISASMTADGSAIILRLPHGHGWLFRGEGGGANSNAITIEDSLYVPTPEGAIKTSQIVMSGRWSGAETRFNWSFRRMDSKD